MVAMKRSCLDAEELGRVLSGRLSAADFDSAIAHLDSCESCRLSAESAEQSNNWIVESLAGSSDPLQAETACQVALWQILETSKFSDVGFEAMASVPLETLGPYRLIRSLGSGGMANVYLAEHERLKRRCAVKILPRERVDQPGWLERFDREMITIASLEHPHVVRATDAGHESGWHYLVMEHLDGLDVGRVASRMQRLQIADACEITRQAALGLSHVHAAGLVHRDVKPSNLMLTSSGTIKLLDLGLVLSGDDPLAVDDRLTTVGHLMGTMPYMAPEQLLDSRDVDARADVYALGATLYRLIAGNPPHQGHGGLAKHVMAITSQDANPLDSVREDVEKDLVKLVAEMLSRDPNLRPATTEDVAKRLENFCDNHALSALLRQANRKSPSESERSLMSARPSLNQPQAVQSPPQRRNWIALGLLSLFVLIAGFTIKVATDKGSVTINVNEVVQDLPKDGLTISIHQDNEEIRRVDLMPNDDNRVVLHKGTYTIKVEGDHELELSGDLVRVERGSRQTIDLLPVSDARLYDGKSLNQWMHLLTVEEAPAALSQIMNAVEVLTRKSKDKRIAAAKLALRTARLWGGYSAGGGDASGVYMSALTDIFPRFGAEAFPAIEHELVQGNTKSRAAVIFLLGGTNLQKGKPPVSIIKPLERTVQDLESSDLFMRDYVAADAVKLTLKILLQHDQSTTQPWLEKYVRKSSRVAIQAYQDKASSFGSSRPSWIVNEEVLYAAIEQAQLDKLNMNWTWAADVLTHHKYKRRSDYSNRIFNTIAKHAPEVLIVRIQARLEGMRVPIAEQIGQTSFDHSIFWNGNEIRAYVLGKNDSIWPQALEYYAANCKSKPDALELMQTIRQTMVRNGADPEHPSEPFQWIDGSIDALKQ